MGHSRKPRPRSQVGIKQYELAHKSINQSIIVQIAFVKPVTFARDLKSINQSINQGADSIRKTGCVSSIDLKNNQLITRSIMVQILR